MKSRLTKIESAEDLLDALQEVRLLSKFNLVFVQVLLILLKRLDLETHVDEYAKSRRRYSEVNPLHLTIAKCKYAVNLTNLIFFPENLGLNC